MIFHGTFQSNKLLILEFLPRTFFSGFQYLKLAEVSSLLLLDPTMGLTDPHGPQLDWEC